MASSSSIREEQIPPRGYLYLIILAKGPFNDTQFNISRSLMLFQSTSTTNNLHVFTFFVPFVHSRIFAFMIIEWKCNISAEGTFFLGFKIRNDYVKNTAQRVGSCERKLNLF